VAPEGSPRIGEPPVHTVALSQGYRKTMVFADLNLDFWPGITVLLGPNGAGKTTLLRTLATVTPPVSGELHVNGLSVLSERDARHARASIGYLPQQFSFFPGFTVRECVTYLAWLRGVPSGSMQESVEDALVAVDLRSQSAQRMKRLSGGMAQRVGLAGAIVGRPGFVVLDEPTVGLDPAQRVRFRNTVRGLVGSSVLLSTHLVEDAAAIADRILVMDRGRMVFDGSPRDLALRGSGAKGDSPLERGYMGLVAGQFGAGGTE